MLWRNRKIKSISPYFNFGLSCIWVAILISYIVASVAAAIVSRKYLPYKKIEEFILPPLS
ncbi:hypothetical protein FDG75_05930 [Clostridium botulinum]|nr:hypothetical protein [Clostridium botulinum]NFQ09116.1 hypothetical protein [Clostridium botulinum]